MAKEIPALVLNDTAMASVVNGAPTPYHKIDEATSALWEIDAKMHESSGALESALSEDFASVEAYLVELEDLREDRLKDGVMQFIRDNYGDYVLIDLDSKLEKFISEVATHAL